MSGQQRRAQLRCWSEAGHREHTAGADVLEHDGVRARLRIDAGSDWPTTPEGIQVELDGGLYLCWPTNFGDHREVIAWAVRPTPGGKLQLLGPNDRP